LLPTIQILSLRSLLLRNKACTKRLICFTITSEGSVRHAGATGAAPEGSPRSTLGGTCLPTNSTTQHIEFWPIERLVEYARNPRKNDAAVDRMCGSIREFGFKIPCLVRSDGEVVDGHLRLKAARKLGLTEIPVILCDEWTRAQVKAFRLMVNRSVTWADWDEELLSQELLALKVLDFDLNLTGFEDEELRRLLAAQDAAEGLTDEDAIPEVLETPISVTGDLWILGDHKLLVGDATLGDDVARLMAGAAADLAFTDPPYNVDYEGYTEDRLKIKGDRMSDAEFK